MAAAHHDHDHAHDADGSHGDRRRILAAALLAGAFVVVEATAGFLTGSLALLADAGHMLTDAAALGLAYAAYRLGDRPANARMTYGFDRLKILIAYTNGIAVFGIALFIVVEAVERIAAPAPVFGGPMLAVAVAGLVANLAMFAILHGGDRHSLNMRGAILHVLGDLLGSVAAIVAALVILVTGWMPADPILSVLVALLLVGSAWRLTRESGLILLEGAPPHLDRNAVAGDLASHAPGVADVHHMHMWTLDGRRTLATLHARLTPGADADAAITAIKARLAQAHGVDHATVEVETGPGCPDKTGHRREVLRAYGTA